MKCVILSGATGFIGANLARFLLQQGCEVHILMRPGSNPWRIADLLPALHPHITNLEESDNLRAILDQIRPELIYHSAFPSHHPNAPQDRNAMFREGVLGTVGLLDAAVQVGFQRFINLGSSLEYGAHAHLLREDQMLAPTTLRGAAKAAAGLACAQYARQYNCSIVNLRLFSIYGPWEARHRFVPSAILSAFRNTRLPITPPGIVHDWVYVEDVLDACWKAADAPLANDEVLNIGSGLMTSNEDVVQLIQQISGRAIALQPGAYPLRPVDGRYWAADTEKSRNLLGWQARHTLANGLEKNIAWFFQHQALYD